MSIRINTYCSKTTSLSYSGTNYLFLKNKINGLGDRKYRVICWNRGISKNKLSIINHPNIIPMNLCINYVQKRTQFVNIMERI